MRTELARTLAWIGVLGGFVACAPARVAAQEAAPRPAAGPPVAGAPAAAPTTGASAAVPTTASGVAAPTSAVAARAADFVIGPDDLLSVVFWRDRDMSAEVTVRPDGRISLPLLNEIQAAGYTPEQLRVVLEKAAAKYLEEPTATVVVREVRSRKVFITGNVARPAAYPLTSEMTVLQLIALAGGLLEYADASNIVVLRHDASGQRYLGMNYNDVVKHKKIGQNVTLKPGDTVVVP